MGVRSGLGRSPRRLRLLARYGADTDFSSVGGAAKWKGKHWRTQDLKKGGVVVEGDHQKGEGAGGGCAPSRAKRGSF